MKTVAPWADRLQKALFSNIEENVMHRSVPTLFLLCACFAVSATAQDVAVRTLKMFPPGLFQSGFYVDVETPCEEASNASTLLVGRAWYSGEISEIKQKSPRVFEISVTGFHQGHENFFQETVHFESTSVLCELAEDEQCSRKRRYCPQQQMPNFRNNDIRSIDGE